MAAVQPDNAIRGLPSGAVTDQIFSIDGKTLYTARNGTITAYDVTSGTAVKSWTIGTSLGGINISPDGNSLIAMELTPGPQTGTWPNLVAQYSLYRLDVQSGQVRTYTITESDSYPEGYADVTYLSDGKVLVGGGGQWQPLVLLDLTTGSTTANSGSYYRTAITASADRTKVVVSETGISDASFNVYTAGAGVTVHRGGYADNISGYNSGVHAISSDGSLIAQGVSLAIYDGSLRLITKLADRYPFSASGLAFSPDGSKLFVLDNQSNLVLALSTTTWDVLGGYPVGASVTGSDSFPSYGAPSTGRYGNALLVSPDGTRLAVGTAGSVQIIDLGKAVSDTGTSQGNDTLVGTSDRNVLYGFEGDDTLDGRGGSDVMIGGPGNDIYYVDQIGDSVTERAGGGDDIVYVSVNNFTVPGQVERLTLTGSATLVNGNSEANNLTGNDLDNVLYGFGGDDVLSGGLGADVLDGGPGNDRLVGGSGDDQYVVDSSGDVIIEQAGAGFDTIRSSVSFTLPAFVERLVLTGSNPINADGGAGNDSIVGNTASNILRGGDGNDTIEGGGGDDTLTGGAGADVFIFGESGAGADSVTDLAFGTDRFDLGGKAFTAAATVGAATILTHAGGTVQLEGVSGRTLAEWNAQVIGAVNQFNLVASAGVQATVMGTGTVVGAPGVQDVTVRDAPGGITFGATFNQGGDRVHLAGNAGSWTVARSGSSAILSDGDTRVVLPAGTVGIDLIFADGIRTLKVDVAAGAIVLGGQAITTTAQAIATPAGPATATAATDASLSAQMLLLGTEPVTAFSNVRIAGSTTAAETVVVTSGSTVAFGASFNAGGDTVLLPGSAAMYQASRSGSTVSLVSSGERVTLPASEAGITLRFGDGAQALLFVDAAAGEVARFVCAGSRSG